MKGIQDTSSKTLRQLLGNGLTYKIPKFQRDYSWESEQWDDLWQDIQAVVNGEEIGHYLGYLVLQTQDDKNYKIIDGQQRITTASILILAVIKSLQLLINERVDIEKNQKRIENFRNSYIGYLDPVTLISTNKLTLNRNNDDFYKTKLVPQLSLPQRGLNSSERLMRQCFTWFLSKLGAEYQTGESLAAFIDKTVDKLFFTVITVNDELNAFKVFETLNARGVQLSASDLLKNYLFSVVDSQEAHSSEISEIEAMWAKIIGKLGSERFAEFLRVFWNSKYKTVRKNDLFKVIRRQLNSKKEVFELLRSLESASDLYMALRNPFDELWRGRKKIIHYLNAIKTFQVRQPFSLLLAAHSHLDKQQFEKILKDITHISFRYNVIGGRNPNDQETIYNELALNVRSTFNYDQSILQKINPINEAFATAFSNKEFKRTSRNHKIVKYILAQIERHMYGSDIDLFSDQYTIEHIMPEELSDYWSHIADDEYERCIYRLGNLTVIESGLNQKSGILGFEEKNKLYLKSSMKTTVAIAKHYSQWGESEINSRQNELAKHAKQIWRL